MGEMWLVCGASPRDIEAMRIDRFWFWHQMAVEFFGTKGGAAPKSAVQALHTEQITQFVKGLRGT